mgnify:CR=1
FANRWIFVKIIGLSFDLPGSKDVVSERGIPSIWVCNNFKIDGPW